MYDESPAVPSPPIAVSDGIARRDFLLSIAALACHPGAEQATRLRDLASRKGLIFGTEVLYQELTGDPDYAALVVEQCGAITPGWEAKWDQIAPSRDRFEFERLDWLVDFAARHGLAVRLHTLIRSLAMPPWLKSALAAGEGQKVLARHVSAVVGRYRGRVHSWDVANEITDPAWRLGPEGLTFTPWRKALGPGVMADAFRLVHEADPTAKLFVNDDGLEYGGRDRDEKRAIYLRLIEGWLGQGVPVHGFGLQTHLRPDRRFAEREYRKFLADLAALGLELQITELDVQDRTLPAEIAARDRAVADLCRRVLDVALGERAVRMVTIWGLSDRYSYQNEDPATRRSDGLQSRGLPYDEQLRPKPMWQALAEAFAHAPDR